MNLSENDLLRAENAALRRDLAQCQHDAQVRAVNLDLLTRFVCAVATRDGGTLTVTPDDVNAAEQACLNRFRLEMVKRADGRADCRLATVPLSPAERAQYLAAVAAQAAAASPTPKRPRLVVPD